MVAWKDYCRLMDNPHGPTKSDMKINDKKTNASAEFNPRDNDYWFDSNRTKLFLQFMIKTHGVNEHTILFHEFKQNMGVVYGNVYEAFALVDTNMDGILKLREVSELSPRELRRFYLKGYRYLGSGKLPDDALCFYGPPPEDAEEQVEEPPIFGVLGRMFEELKEGKKESWSVKDFTQLIHDSNAFHPDFNVNFVFGMIDWDKKGFVTQENLDRIINGNEDLNAKKFRSNDTEVALVEREKRPVITLKGAFYNMMDAMMNVNNFMRKVLEIKKAQAAEVKRDEL
uniref:EF-hand domain-containing protein n=1 Tax=Ciona savignyi TaxID=51511 RepID=H2YH85_CIOSA